MRDRIAVSGVGGGVGQAVVRALRLASPEYWIVGMDMNPYSAGLYLADAGVQIPASSAPEYVGRLLEVLIRERITALIPGSDPELLVLAKARPQIEAAGIRVIVGTPDSVEICRDKRRSSDHFRRLGFPFVRTVPISEAHCLADEVGFPLVVKPLAGSASRGVAVVFSSSQLAPYLEEQDYIAQEPAFPAAWTRDGRRIGADVVHRAGALRQEEEISIQVIYDHEGEHLGTFTSVNRLQGGVPVFVDPQRIPEVETVVEQMANALRDQGMVGPCNFQCRLTEDGPKVFEINPRFTGITAVRAAMGFNAVEAVLSRVLRNVPAETARACLVQPADQLSVRYVDESVVPRQSFTET